MTWKTAAFFLAVPAAFIGASIRHVHDAVQVCGGALVLLALLFGGMLFENRALLEARSIRAIGLATWASFAVVVSVLVYQWPLRTAYKLSQRAIERVADDVRAGRPFHTPALVGAFRIERAEISPQGVTCLWMDLNPAGRTGLVQCSPKRPPFNLWSLTSLDERWQCITED